MLFSALCNALLVLSVILPVVVSGETSDVVVTATREYNETLPDCAEYADLVREKMNEEFAANGYGGDRKLRSTNRDLQIITSPIKSPTIPEPSCTSLCYQLRAHPGFCFVYSDQRCGVQVRRLEERELVTAEQHQACLDRQHMILQSLVRAALYVEMPFECREHYWSNWKTACYTPDGLPTKGDD